MTNKNDWLGQDTKLYSCQLHIKDTKFNIYLDNSFTGSGSWTMAFHNHPVYEVHIIKNGVHDFNIEQRQVILRAGHCCIIKPHVYHSITNISEEETNRCSFRFEFFSDNKFINKIFLSAETTKAFNILEYTDRDLYLIDTIISEITNKEYGFQAAIDGLLVQLILSIIRQLAGKSKNERDIDTDYLEENRYDKIDVFFHERYMDDTPVEDLAKYVNLSVRQVNRILNQAYGLTYKQKLLQMRITYAKHMLSQEQMQIKEISSNIGFRSPAYFTNSFRKIVGMSPEQYRNSIKCARKNGNATD